MKSNFLKVMTALVLLVSFSAYAVGPDTCAAERDAHDADQAQYGTAQLSKNRKHWLITNKDTKDFLEWYLKNQEDIRRSSPNQKETPSGIYAECLVKARLAELNATGSKGRASTSQPTQQAARPTSNRAADRYGALAMAGGRGNMYGWAYDFSSQEEANKRVLDECNQYGTGNCKVVMEFRNACASYAVDGARSSTVYGWAYNVDKGAADAEALRACTNRGGSNSQCTIRVWGCTTR